MENVFFSESGLTSTSANHLANLAKEYVQEVENRLAGVKFYRTEVALIGTDTSNLLSDGWSDEQLTVVQSDLRKIAEAKSLIAWLREAIKARSQALNEVESMDIYDWARKVGIVDEMPTKPVRKEATTKEDIIAGMNIKERNRIFALETRAATFGKYVHPDGNFAKARKNFLKRQSEQNEISGEGRDALIYHYIPTANADTIEDVFFTLQSIHRTIQAQLNNIMHDIDEKVREMNQKAESDYFQELSEYQIAMEKLQSQFKMYKSDLLKSISSMKIVIPNDLMDIYETMNKLGK